MLYCLRDGVGIYSLCQAFNDFGTFFNSNSPAVQRDMIVGGIALLHIGVEAIVGGTALVLLLQTGFGRFLPFPIDPHDAVSPEQIGRAHV